MMGVFLFLSLEHSQQSRNTLYGLLYTFKTVAQYCLKIKIGMDQQRNVISNYILNSFSSFFNQLIFPVVSDK